MEYVSVILGMSGDEYFRFRINDLPRVPDILIEKLCTNEICKDYKNFYEIILLTDENEILFQGIYKRFKNFYDSEFDTTESLFTSNQDIIKNISGNILDGKINENIDISKIKNNIRLLITKWPFSIKSFTFVEHYNRTIAGCRTTHDCSASRLEISINCDDKDYNFKEIYPDDYTYLIEHELEYTIRDYRICLSDSGYLGIEAYDYKRCIHIKSIYSDILDNLNTMNDYLKDIVNSKLIKLKLNPQQHTKVLKLLLLCICVKMEIDICAYTKLNYDVSPNNLSNITNINYIKKIINYIDNCPYILLIN